MNIGFLDVETGGLSITKNAVCEIAMVAIAPNLEIIDEFQCYIKPYPRDETGELVSYKDDAMAIHGITLETLNMYGIYVGGAMFEMQQFIQKHKITTIAGHNVKIFDIPRVEHLFSRFNPAYNLFGFPTIDTLQMARKKWPGLASHKLECLCSLLSIPNPNKHRALRDCYSDIELYKLLIK